MKQYAFRDLFGTPDKVSLTSKVLLQLLVAEALPHRDKHIALLLDTGFEKLLGDE